MVLGALEREAGLDHLREAVAILEPSPARLEHAKALTALGEVLRATGAVDEARPALREALRLSEACGAEPVAARARAELRATGEQPPHAAATGVLALTASERRIAELAARGEDERDIAQALFVTPQRTARRLVRAARPAGSPRFAADPPRKQVRP